MLATTIAALALLPGPLAKPSETVLVFSKTTGFRHDSIPVAVEAIKKLGETRNWSVTATEDASIFTSEGLRPFQVVVFLLTTGDVLDDVQQNAFEAFIEKGGGYVGVHSACDTEYDWPWYGRLAGAYFKSHPHIQEASVVIEDAKHPTTRFLPNPWKRTDEWYNLRESPRPKVKVLAHLDVKSYQGNEMGDDHPMIWWQNVGKGRSWFTAMGHTEESYADPLFTKMLAEAIRWAGRR